MQRPKPTSQRPDRRALTALEEDFSVLSFIYSLRCLSPAYVYWFEIANIYCMSPTHLILLGLLVEPASCYVYYFIFQKSLVLLMSF